MSTSAVLNREVFRTSRELEYFTQKELTLQTGHEPARWSEVILKELIDNGLDACEEAGQLPEIHVRVTDDSIMVEDNGPGLPAGAVQSALDYSVRASSKDAYISPTRGAQGNALKTIFAIPYVLSGEAGIVTIDTPHASHHISVSTDRIAQEPRIEHTAAAPVVKIGTSVTVWASHKPRRRRPVSYKWLKTIRSSTLTRLLSLRRTARRTDLSGPPTLS